MPFGWAAGAAAVGSAVNGIIGSNAAKSAASAEAQGYGQAIDTEQQSFDTTKANLQPYMTGGTNALSALQKMLNIGPGTAGGASSPILQMLGYGPGGTPGGGVNPSTFQASPGYQYALQQGTNAVTNSAAASGGIGGNALKALQSTGQGLANQNWSQYLSQLASAYGGLTGSLGSLAGAGQTAATNLGNIGEGVAAQIGNDYIGAGSARGSGIMGSANAIAGGINGVLGAAGSSPGGGLNTNSMLYALMNQNLSQGGTGGIVSGSGGTLNYGQNVAPPGQQLFY